MNGENAGYQLRIKNYELRILMDRYELLNDLTPQIFFAENIYSFVLSIIIKFNVLQKG